MSLRVSKRPSTPAATPRGRARDTLPPALIVATANRLSPFALSVAVAIAVYAALDYTGFHHFDRPGQASWPWLLSLFGGIGLSLTIAWIARRELLPPEKLLD